MRVTILATAALLAAGSAAADGLAPRDVPAKTVPVPATISPDMQAVVAQPLRTGWNTPPTTPEAWAEFVAASEKAAAPGA